MGIDLKGIFPDKLAKNKKTISTYTTQKEALKERACFNNSDTLATRDEKRVNLEK